MMKNNGRKGLVIAGACLLVAAMVVFFGWQWHINTWADRTKDYVDTICSAIPQPQGAVPESRSDNTMSALWLDGRDFIGILELPDYNSVLPVSGAWGDVSRYPCRFDGSIYDGSLMIGATSQKGQYDFYREISPGDKVCFTDMEGNRYVYYVTDIRYEPRTDRDTLQQTKGELTLFIKNIYALESIVISCSS